MASNIIWNIFRIEFYHLSNSLNCSYHGVCFWCDKECSWGLMAITSSTCFSAKYVTTLYKHPRCYLLFSVIRICYLNQSQYRFCVPFLLWRRYSFVSEIYLLLPVNFIFPSWLIYSQYLFCGFQQATILKGNWSTQSSLQRKRNENCWSCNCTCSRKSKFCGR